MRLSWVSLAVFVGSVFAQSSSVDSYIASQGPISKTGLLANIGGSGSKAAGAKVHLLWLVHKLRPNSIASTSLVLLSPVLARPTLRTFSRGRETLPSFTRLSLISSLVAKMLPSVVQLMTSSLPRLPSNKSQTLVEL